ncbi:hypothetical protein D3C83_277800 [compost metagenome]
MLGLIYQPMVGGKAGIKVSRRAVLADRNAGVLNRLIRKQKLASDDTGFGMLVRMPQ